MAPSSINAPDIVDRAGRRVTHRAIWDIGQPAELTYRMGFNPLQARVRRGR